MFVVALLGAVLIGGAITAQTYLSMLGHGHSPGGMLAWQVGSWSLWALVAPLVIRESAGLSRRGPGARTTWTRLGALGLVLVPLHVFLAAQLALWVQPFVPVVVSNLGETFLTQLGSMLPVDVLAYTTLVLIGWAVGASRTARQLEVRESRLEAELAKARLEALRLEIQPHFLFNTLNTIAALIRLKSNDAALEMVVGLGDLMRQTLERANDQHVTLEAELEFTKRYIETSDVLWIEAQDYYARVHARTGRHLVRATVLSLEAKLDPRRFLRVHRAAIVNVDEVREVGDRGGMHVVLSNGTRIPVSRARRRKVESVLTPRLRST